MLTLTIQDTSDCPNPTSQEESSVDETRPGRKYRVHTHCKDIQGHTTIQMMLASEYCGSIPLERLQATSAL